MALKLSMTAEKPVALRGPQSKELTEDQETILEFFRASMKAYLNETPEQAVTFTVTSIDDVNKYRKLVVWAAKQEEWGARFRFNEEQNGALAVTFWAVPLTERLYTECPICKKSVQITESNELRTHGPKDDRCKGSGLEVKVS